MNIPGRRIEQLQLSLDAPPSQTSDDCEWHFSVDGDVMTLTWVSSDIHQRIGAGVVRSTLPVSTTRMKLIRVE